MFDPEVNGFAGRVKASTARTLAIDDRHARLQRRMTMMRWPDRNATAPRERAKELRRPIDNGQQPGVGPRRGEVDAKRTMTGHLMNAASV